jgi:outer membrane protein assembly factor BamB
MWARRGVIAAVLVGAAVIPGRASSQANSHCAGAGCKAAGSILWTRGLSGPWVAQDGVTGTVPAGGQAFTAATGALAVLGRGTRVTAFQAQTGRVSWEEVLSGLPAGAAIVSVRAWPSVVAVGVAVPAAPGGQTRFEDILSAVTGALIRSYPAAEYGGAVRADTASAVIVGATAVTSYANASGRVLWQRPTGRVAQSWTVAGPYLYVAETAGGYLGSAPVTALRRIDLRTGAERVVRPRGRVFAGTLAGVIGGVVLFSDSNGLSGYGALTGKLLWQRASVTLELIDQGRQSVYVAAGDALTELNVTTADAASSPARSLSASLYAVRNGVALGLDQGPGAIGEAWGFSMAARQVVWTSQALPWPHFFVDLTGLGGSLSTAGNITLLTTCAELGPAIGTSGAAACLRPELAAIQF